jgi:uncharacterized protein (UPF0332 family)
MTWAKLLAANRVAREPTSKQELDELREMARLNLQDASVKGLSARGRYEFAYNAARLLATLVVRAAGYRITAKGSHHYYTFAALEITDGAFAKTAAYFDSARSKRNDFSYDSPVPISDTDADELVRTAKQFAQQAETWIKTKHPSLA